MLLLLTICGLSWHQAGANHHFGSFITESLILSRRASNFRPESIRCLFKCLLDRLLSELLILEVILARVAVTVARDAVESRRKALTVELEAL